MSILLIEDDPLWEDAIVGELEEAGYQVEVADTFEKARAMLNLDSEQTVCKQSKFDLLIALPLFSALFCTSLQYCCQSKYSRRTRLASFLTVVIIFLFLKKDF